MRAVVQRVKNASVSVNEETIASIGQGLLVFTGITHDDSLSDLEWIAGKIVQTRIFEDENGKMNLSAAQIRGSILLVSQFTLHASTRKGNRPSFTAAAPPSMAAPLFEKFVNRVKELFNGPVYCGIFGADMKINLLNDGPVTLIMDSKMPE